MENGQWRGPPANGHHGDGHCEDGRQPRAPRPSLTGEQSADDGQHEFEEQKEAEGQNRRGRQSWCEEQKEVEGMPLRSRRRPKIINDGLHGIIEIGGRCLAILDTPQFQRLRHIRQVQACCYVFPSAQHSRLEHSLGVYHLSGVLLSKIRARQPELGVSDSDMEMVQMAGLCHDLGHGCFSHMLDYELFPKVVQNFDWHHETRSCEVLQYLVDENNIDLDKDEIADVQSLIKGDLSKAKYHFEEEGRKKKFLWDIVNNARHGVDVDKFDYLARDSRECRINISFDSARLIELMRVVDDEICFNEAEAEAVYDLFHSRAKMYRQAYFHKATRAIERMISDAILAARPLFDLREYVHNIPKFCKLDDTILREISRSTDPRLEESRNIIHRIERRDLYQYVDEFVVPWDKAEVLKTVTEDDIWRHKPEGCRVKKEELIVQVLKIDYGKGDKNPVERVRFYDDREHGQRTKHVLEPERVSNFLPSKYQDVTVRLYVKERNPQKVSDAIEMFSKYQTKEFGKEVTRTPSLKRKASEATGEEDDDEYEFEFQSSQTQPTSQPGSQPASQTCKRLSL